MTYTIKNNKLNVSINSYGAELNSIINNEGLHYLYEGNSTYWNFKAPILFPIVGRLRNKKYNYAGKFYEMNGHGFARISNFELTTRFETSITFTLSDNEETLKIYPFNFRLDIIYELINDILSIKNIVQNTGKDVMYFSIGAHEGYNCPLIRGEEFTDYDIIFEKNETIGSQCMNISNGLRTGETYPLLNDSNILPLKYDYFYTDAIMLINQRSRKTTLKSRKSGKGVEVCFPDFPMLGI